MFIYEIVERYKAHIEFTKEMISVIKEDFDEFGNEGLNYIQRVSKMIVEYHTTMEEDITQREITLILLVKLCQERKIRHSIVGRVESEIPQLYFEAFNVFLDDFNGGDTLFLGFNPLMLPT